MSNDNGKRLKKKKWTTESKRPKWNSALRTMFSSITCRNCLNSVVADERVLHSRFVAQRRRRQWNEKGERFRSTLFRMSTFQMTDFRLPTHLIFIVFADDFFVFFFLFFLRCFFSFRCLNLLICRCTFYQLVQLQNWTYKDYFCCDWIDTFKMKFIYFQNLCQTSFDPLFFPHFGPAFHWIFCAFFLSTRHFRRMNLNGAAGSRFRNGLFLFRAMWFVGFYCSSSVHYIVHRPKSAFFCFLCAKSTVVVTIRYKTK